MVNHRCAVVVKATLLVSIVWFYAASICISQTLPSNSIATAKLNFPYVDLSYKVVTAVLSDNQGNKFIYIQEPVDSPNPHNGVKVKVPSDMAVSPGDTVSAFGYTESVEGLPEYMISLLCVNVDGTGSIPPPLAMSGIMTAGGAFGSQPALYRKTPDKVGCGLNPVGLRVKVWGKVTWTDGDKVCFIDDGSNLKSMYLGEERTGLRLIYPLKCSYGAGSFVVVTGVLGAEMSDDNYPVPVVRAEPRAYGISVIGNNSSSYANGSIPLYEKYELTFTVDNIGQPFIDFNPFNPNTSTLSSDYWNLKGIRVDAILTSPQWQTIEWPCFWYEGSDGWTGWKMRFTPREAGTWSYKLRVCYDGGTFETETMTFSCCSGTDNGFLAVSALDKRYFEFSNGKPFYPIGVDLSGWTEYSDLQAMAQDCLPRISANGGNCSRVLSVSTNIETYHDSTKYLNKYSMSHARQIDAVIEAAEANGVYLEWCLDDWTWLKDNPDGTVANKNQYLKSYDPATGVVQRDAPCATVEEFFSSPVAQEIYKRKLRYWMARWGYSPNLMGIELINELGGGGGSNDEWHQLMANFLRGDDNAVPSSWGSGDIQDLDAQPHMVSSSNGSTELRTSGGICWNGTGNTTCDRISVDGTMIDKPGMDYVNYHDYARDSLHWSTLDGKCDYPLERLGSTLERPWQDTSLWTDRTGRVYHKKLQWAKPLCWSEYGLIKTDEGWHDWGDAYNSDLTARHFRDMIWPGAFCGVSILHWKIDYMRGGGSFTAGGDKFWSLKPLANFLEGEDLRGLQQETAYPGLVNPVKVECSNPNVLAMAMVSSTKAYLYVKNLTDVWYRLVDPTASGLPTPADQSATIRIYGLAQATYILEKWSTSEPDKAAQLLSSQMLNIYSPGTLELPVTVGCGQTSGYDCAYKLRLVAYIIKF